jgi:hypothetical protein
LLAAMASLGGWIIVAALLGSATVENLFSGLAAAALVGAGTYFSSGRQRTNSAKDRRREEDDEIRRQQEWDEAHWNERGR